MFGYNTPKDIIQLETVFKEGLAGSDVAHAQVFYDSGDGYKASLNEDFIFDIMTVAHVPSPLPEEDNSFTVADEIEEFIRTVRALNYSFNVKIDIMFANGSTLIWYINKMVKDSYKG